MNKVITINLNGNAWQLDEAGYDALRAYLDAASRALAANPDRDEIIADIEQAIADKCRASLGAHRTVVSTADITAIIAGMGPVEGGDSPSDADPAGPAPAAAGRPAQGAANSATPRRLYRIREGALISGVCNGLAAYFAVDVNIVRFVFLLLAFLTAGTMALVYVAMILLVPVASSPEETAAALGGPNTTQDFIHRAKAGYYEGLKHLRDKQKRRVWQRRFRREMHGWGRTFHQEMHAASRRWHTQWPTGPGLWITASFLGLLRAGLMVGWIFALISLFNTGAIFGLALPAGLPVWAAYVILCLLYVILDSPLRIARRASRVWGWGGGYERPPSCLNAWDALFSVGIIVLAVWMIDRHVPHAHEALKSLPAEIHHGIDTVKQWWARQ